MSAWKNCCISKDTSIIETLRTIDEVALQFALVVSEKNHLLGVVTDGDIRRGLLRGVELSSPVEEIMNTKPVVANIRQEKHCIANMMRKYTLHHIPVVNDKNELVNLYTMEDVLYKKQRDNVVVLMAGGLGTRLRPLTDKVPKPLLKVGSKPILETIIENFIDSGFYRFYLSVNYKSEMIEKYFGDGSNFGVEINYIHEKKRMGTAGALYFLPEMLKEPAIVMNGDLLTKVDFGDFLDFHREARAIATMGVREYSYQVPYGVIDYNGNGIVKICEKPSHQYLVNAGMYVLSPEAVAYVQEEKFLDMPDLFNKLIENKEKTTVYPVREYWMDIGRIDEFEQAQKDYEDVFLTPK